VDKKHWTIWAEEVGLNGVYDEIDDGNPAWEDIEDEDIAAAEARWRANDIENGERIVERTDMPDGRSLTKAFAKVGKVSRL
jgi:hypothetical protein